MKKYFNNEYKHLIHGADYNPEQWIGYDGIWAKDMELMKKANFNEMTVGIFSWSFLEPKDGEYDFSLLDNVISMVEKNGGKVMLATPSGARPHWLSDKYPSVLRVNVHNVRENFNVRHNHCYTSPDYRRKVKEIDTLLAQRYGKNKTVVVWHISNEYSGQCFCPLCRDAFRNYLRKKFDGDIEKLNATYWTGFWSHKFDSFEQVDPPMDYTETMLNGLNIDWRRFCTMQAADFMKEEISALRKYSSIPVTTNFMRGYYDYDYRVFAKEVDVISWDNYPDWHEGVQAGAETAFWHDIYRCMGDKPFLMMESTPSITNWKEYNSLSRPGISKLCSLQAVAHGSDSVQYFQWRKSRGGEEKLHGAVVDHEGSENTRVFKEVSDTGRTLKAIDEVAGTLVKNDVAVIYEWDNMWALDIVSGFQKKDKKYNDTVIDYHKAFWEKNIGVDVIGSDDDFSKYKLIVCPMMYLLKESAIQKIEKYVKSGGYFFATYMLGMVDENDLCYLGGLPAKGLKKVFGIWNEEIDSLLPEIKTQIKMNGERFFGMDYSEIIHPSTAKALAEYDSEFYKGNPCFTVNQYGKGKAFYQAFRDDGEFKRKVISDLTEELKIESVIPKSEYGVAAQKRTSGKTDYIFVENFTDKKVENVSLGKVYVDLISKEEQEKTDLNPFEVKVFKRKK